MFYWNRGGVGGRSAVDFLMKVQGMGFVDAVEMVVGMRSSPVFTALPVEKRNTQQIAKAEFKLLETAQFPSNTVAYL